MVAAVETGNSVHKIARQVLKNTLRIELPRFCTDGMTVRAFEDRIEFLKTLPIAQDVDLENCYLEHKGRCLSFYFRSKLEDGISHEDWETFKLILNLPAGSRFIIFRSSKPNKV